MPGLPGGLLRRTNERLLGWLARRAFPQQTFQPCIELIELAEQIVLLGVDFGQQAASGNRREFKLVAHEGGWHRVASRSAEMIGPIRQRSRRFAGRFGLERRGKRVRRRKFASTLEA